MISVDARYYDSAKRILKKETYSERSIYKRDSLLSHKMETSIKLIHYDDFGVQKMEFSNKNGINKTIFFTYNSLGLITSISYVDQENNKEEEFEYQHVFY